jgi:hypothetical protein
MKASLLIFLSTFFVANVFAAPPQIPLTVTVQGDGVVVSDPVGIICPSKCVESYNKNSNIILTATANPNSSFLGWNGACVGTQPTCEIKLMSPTAITATFETSTVVSPAPVPQTGQTTCYDQVGAQIDCTGTGQDGEYKKGIPWPEPRFTDNEDGTVTDNLTGLGWLKDANCIATKYPEFDNQNTLGDGLVTWQHALDFVAGINDGTYPDCGAGRTDWRLANIRELRSLTDYGNNMPCLPTNYPFENINAYSRYWSSTSHPRNHGNAAVTSFWDCENGFGISFTDKDHLEADHDYYLFQVWPVRGPN